MATKNDSGGGCGSGFFIFMIVFSFVAVVGGIIGSVFLVMERPEALEPLLCAENSRLETKSYRLPDSTTSIEFYCVDPEGIEENITGNIFSSFFNGITAAVVGLIILLFIFGKLASRSNKKAMGDFVSVPKPGAASAQKERPSTTSSMMGVDEQAMKGDAKAKLSHDIEQRLATLKRAYDQQLITREEYEQKKADVLKEV